MKVSIITICLNSENTISDTISSVVNQTYSNIEYIIIDGNSSDKTLGIINRFSNSINHLISENDQGMYYAMNKGINLASGELIGVLHSDDLFYDDCVVEKVVDSVVSNNSDCVYGDLIYFSNNNTKRYWRAGSYNAWKMYLGWMPPHPTFFVKKCIYNKFGDFNVSFKTSADYELMLRLLFKYCIKASYIPETLVKMRLGGQSNKSIKNRIKANIEDSKAWAVNDLKMPFYTRYLKPLLKVNQYIKKC